MFSGGIFKSLLTMECLTFHFCEYHLEHNRNRLFSLAGLVARFCNTGSIEELGTQEAECEEEVWIVIDVGTLLSVPSFERSLVLRGKQCV